MQVQNTATILQLSKALKKRNIKAKAADMRWYRTCKSMKR